MSASLYRRHVGCGETLAQSEQLGVLAEVLDGELHHVDVVLELTETGVAVEAQDPAHLAGLVVVVDVRPLERPFANRTHPTLDLDHRRDVGVTNPVATNQVVVPSAAIEPV